MEAKEYDQDLTDALQDIKELKADNKMLSDVVSLVTEANDKLRKLHTSPDIAELSQAIDSVGKVEFEIAKLETELVLAKNELDIAKANELKSEEPPTGKNQKERDADLLIRVYPFQETVMNLELQLIDGKRALRAAQNKLRLQWLLNGRQR